MIAIRSQQNCILYSVSKVPAIGFDVYRTQKLDRVEDDEAFEDYSYLMAAEPLLPPDPD